MNKRYTDLSGEKFERLTVIKKVGSNRYGIIYECLCDCGSVREYTAARLRSGNVKSCGCLRRERFMTHGLSGTRIYRIFQGMKKRCYSKSDQNYSFYGGRGIIICQEWLDDFKSFYNWATENGYEEHLSIERIDTEGNYEPSNCCWIELNKQAKNRRNVHSIEYEGSFFTVRELAEKSGVSEGTLGYRLRAGWKLEDAMNIKPNLANSYLLGRKNGRDEYGRFVD